MISAGQATRIFAGHAK